MTDKIYTWEDIKLARAEGKAQAIKKVLSIIEGFGKHKYDRDIIDVLETEIKEIK